MSKERTSRSCSDAQTQQHSRCAPLPRRHRHQRDGEVPPGRHQLGVLGLPSVFRTHSTAPFWVSSPHKSALQIIYPHGESSFITGLPLSLLSFTVYVTFRFIILNSDLIMTVSYPTPFNDTLGSKESTSSLVGCSVPKTRSHRPASGMPSLASLALRDMWSGFIVWPSPKQAVI